MEGIDECIIRRPAQSTPRKNPGPCDRLDVYLLQAWRARWHAWRRDG